MHATTTAGNLRLVADVGGTRTRALLVDEAGTPLQDYVRVRNDDYADLVAALGDCLTRLAPATAPTQAVIAVAAPITGEEIRLTNRAGWRFSAASIARDLALREVHLVNDFAAVALAVPHLAAGETVAVGEVRTPAPTHARSPLVVLGPGTGLGTAAMVPAGDRWVALPGEGSHAGAAADDAAEAALIDAARAASGHVSWETFLSGPGLLRLYAAVTATRQAPAAAAPAPRDTHTLLERVEAGDATAARTLEVFMGMLGSFAGNLALTFGAFGGVYLAGGLLQRLRTHLLASSFRERFVAKGAYSALLTRVPTSLITLPEPALRGLASFSPAQVVGAGTSSFVAASR